MRFVLRYGDLLQLRFVERAVQCVAVPVDQTIHGRIGSVCFDDRKQIFCPVRHVAFLKVSLSFAYAYAITYSELGCATIFVVI